MALVAEEANLGSSRLQRWSGLLKARWPTATICFHALVTIVVGSSKTPERPGDASTFIAYSGSLLQRSDMNPSICLMPRWVYWQLRHMFPRQPDTGVDLVQQMMAKIGTYSLFNSRSSLLGPPAPL